MTISVRLRGLQLLSYHLRPIVVCVKTELRPLPFAVAVNDPVLGNWDVPVERIVHERISRDDRERISLLFYIGRDLSNVLVNVESENLNIRTAMHLFVQLLEPG